MKDVLNCLDNKEKISNNKKLLKIVQSRLKEFPLLSSLFNNFDDYITEIEVGKDIPDNVIFNLFSSDKYLNHIIKII